jgi:hypothetical protein
MKRRSRSSGKTPKPQSQKRGQRSDPLREQPRRTSSAVVQEPELASLTRDLNEAREQLTATSEVLRVISSARGELEPVFQSMLENATHLCGAEFGILWLTERNGFRPVALHNVPLVLAVSRRRDQIIEFIPEAPLGRVANLAAMEADLAFGPAPAVTDAASTPAYAARRAAVSCFEIAGRLAARIASGIHYSNLTWNFCQS